MVDAAKDRDDQAVRQRDRHAEVHVAEAGDLRAVEVRVERGVARARSRWPWRRSRRAKLDAFGFELLVHLRAQLRQVLDVDVDGLVEVRDRAAWTAAVAAR